MLMLLKISKNHHESLTGIDALDSDKGDCRMDLGTNSAACGDKGNFFSSRLWSTTIGEVGPM